MTSQSLSFCRACASDRLLPIISFGAVPLVADFIVPGEIENEILYELDLDFCSKCSLVQIREVPSPQVIFGGNYPYYSSVSRTLNVQTRQFVNRMIDERNLDQNSDVIEIASNDGYLLRNFVEQDISVLGIDSSPGPVGNARNIGVETLNEYFTLDLAKNLAKRGIRADLVVANNVLAHVPDISGFVCGLKLLLKPKGIVSIDVGYAPDQFAATAFDSIYHEHHCYFSLTALNKLLIENGLRIFHAERIAAQGGSLRIFAVNVTNEIEKQQDSVRILLDEEGNSGVTSGVYLKDFKQRVEQVCFELKVLLASITKGQKKIAGYGAAAKGVVLLNALGLNQDVIEYVVDQNLHKQGKLMPGSHIPIVAPQEMEKYPPDYLLVLPWNLREEIIAQHADYIEAGGKLIFPLPRPQIFP